MFRNRSSAVTGLAPLAAVMFLLAGEGVAEVPSDPMEKSITISVAAQPLSESLRSLAKQANLQILFDSAIVAGKPGRALNGAESPRKALTDLLRGTGLEAVEQAPGVIVIRRRSAKGEISRGESFE